MTVPAPAPALVVFAKEPTPGQVKTRLARVHGDEAAATVYRALTAVTLRHAVEARAAGVIARIELWCAPVADSRYFRTLRNDADASLHDQGDGDLGSRMASAIANALTRSARVLLIGTDCPLLDPARLAQAAGCLDTHDVVLGPAEDGGYVLIGARTRVTLDDVRWSTSHAFADTVAALTRARIQWTALPVSWDVDEPADLARWNALRAPLPAMP
jgi:rSAM/selenodomain-associated transferase 1